ncbi:purine/pyrimidine permease [Heliobacterium chlorum]|uniref:Purine/pyrimidine permease n=2 Tax=Heliobacterium chlorum TaxID=2698 RepID=A0ABR7T7Z7_HELCL|nr:purine/pyrimidine permease [Heliobacterium chlorum]
MTLLNVPSYRYGLEDRPPRWQNLIYGLQWLAITVPLIIILGKIVAQIHFTDPMDQITYLQKLFFITAVMLLIQVYWGHQLPLVTGPAAILLVGIITNTGSPMDAIYSSMMICGFLLTVLSATGWFTYLKNLFTPRVVAVILLLIAFTLIPTIINLVIAPEAEGSPLQHLLFSLLLLLVVVAVSQRLSGLWKSTLIIWAMLGGSLIYYLLFPQVPSESAQVPFVASFFRDVTLHVSLEPALIVSMLLCYVALVINDLGSIQSVGKMILADRMPVRISRGVTVTGLVNVLSGFLGIIGPVNFSLSPGVIASTSCASRFTLVPAGVFLFVIAFSPKLIQYLGNIPPVVIGTLLLYIMCSQVATGLRIVFESTDPLSMDNGYIVGLPMMLATVVSFLPPAVTASFPALVRPILGNGFVIGVLAVIILEHFIFRTEDLERG